MGRGTPTLLLLRKRRRGNFVLTLHKQQPVNRRHVPNGTFEQVERPVILERNGLVTTADPALAKTQDDALVFAIPTPHENKR